MSRPAVFLDRDGVLCKERGYITETEQLNIFSFSKTSVSRLHDAGYYCICVTNQSAVGRGILSMEKLEQIHKKLMAEVGLDAIYSCPHLPEAACHCRKPETGMIMQACRDLDIDLSGSIMVGDRWSDILCGQHAGIRTVLLESGYCNIGLESEVLPDYVFKNLEEFTEHYEVFTGGQARRN